MAANPISVDHMVVRIRSADGTHELTALNEWLRNDCRAAGSRVSSDIDYDKFRQTLEDEFGIPKTAKICSETDPDYDIHHARSFWAYITLVQQGKRGPQGDTDDFNIGFEQVPSPDEEDVSKSTLPDDPLKRDPSPIPDDNSILSGTPRPSGQNVIVIPSDSSKSPSPDDKDTGKGKEVDRSEPTEEGKPSGQDVIAVPPDSSKSPNPANKDAGKDEDGEANKPDPTATTMVDNIELVSISDDSSDMDIEKSIDEGNNIAEAIINQQEVTPKDWQAACTFFQCPEDITDLKLNGVKLRLHPYQLWAIWNMLTQVPRRRASFFLADDVGLGKSGMTLVTIHLYHLIHVAREEVNREWENLTLASHRRRHLPWPNSLKHTGCPSQGKSRYPFQCPCVQRGDSYKISQALMPSPSIIICPPELIQSWITEVGKWMELPPVNTHASSSTSINNLRFWISHRDFSDRTGNPAYLGAAALPSILSRPGTARDDGTLQLRPGTGRLQSQHVVLVSSRGIENLEARCQHGKEPRLAATMVFMDEVHSYKGVKGSPTAPFKVLERITETSTGPTLAVGLSASVIGEGPPAWRFLVQHAFHVANLRKWDMNVPLLDEASDVEEWDVYWKYVVRQQGLVNTPRVQALVDERHQYLVDRLKHFVPAFILCRKKTNNFLGTPISSMQPQPLLQEQLDMVDGPVHDAFKTLVSSVKTWIDDYYSQQVKEWRDQGGHDANESDESGESSESSEADKPNKASIQSALLDRNITGGQVPRAYQVLARSSCFPAVAKLYQDGKIEYRYLLTQYTQDLGQKITLAFETGDATPGRSAPRRPPNRTQIESAVLGVLQESGFWQHIDELVNSSPKFAALCRHIDEMHALRGVGDRKVGAVGDNDDKRIQHMLVFSDTNVSAFLTFMCLFNKYRMRFNWIYVHAALGVEQRAAQLQRVQEPCRPSTPNKIVISTFGLAGKGYNLQRANRVILTEIPNSLEVQRQATGRVDRQGQTLTPILVQLYDGRNLAEVVRHRRNANRGNLTEQGPRTIPIESAIPPIDPFLYTPPEYYRGYAL
ncbi:hypothetical protein F4819DRAFT_504252 [Hypoxylon fuscum]|nr:hypothetical protein F4819DRAFT_504252 [Hypoxylon fuscum]